MLCRPHVCYVAEICIVFIKMVYHANYVIPHRHMSYIDNNVACANNVIGR